MGWNGRALAMATEARNVADRTERALTRTTTLLEAHVEGCGKSAQALRDDLQNRERHDQEWRAGLGKRLDAQDRLMWGAVIGVVMLLLGVVSFFLEHSGMFAKV